MDSGAPSISARRTRNPNGLRRVTGRDIQHLPNSAEAGGLGHMSGMFRQENIGLPLRPTWRGGLTFQSVLVASQFAPDCNLIKHL